MSIMEIQRIKSIKPLPNYLLLVLFDDGKQVIYDVKDDFNLPEYDLLRTVEGLFNQVRLDKSRTCVYWNQSIDLPSDILYDYGKQLG